MAEYTLIEWATHTWNPWWGCEKISPACKFCYAEALDKRVGQHNWGKDAPRQLTSESNWRLPLKWNRESAEALLKAQVNGEPVPPRPRVFCSSMADIFEDFSGKMIDHRGSRKYVKDTDDGTDPQLIPMTMDDARAEVFSIIEKTPHLSWLLLTKRPENIARMVPKSWLSNWPDHVWPMATVESQEYAQARIEPLLKLPSRVKGISAEPLLSALSIQQYLGVGKINWVIAGGESGHNARPSNPDWFKFLQRQCRENDVPFLFKQWGNWAEWDGVTKAAPEKTGLWLNDQFHLGGEWRDDRPNSVHVLSKKAAGNALGGVKYLEFPIG